jgi:hypothetical protein
MFKERERRKKRGKGTVVALTLPNCNLICGKLFQGCLKKGKG